MRPGRRQQVGGQCSHDEYVAERATGLKIPSILVTPTKRPTPQTPKARRRWTELIPDNYRMFRFECQI